MILLKNVAQFKYGSA